MKDNRQIKRWITLKNGKRIPIFENQPNKKSGPAVRSFKVNQSIPMNSKYNNAPETIKNQSEKKEYKNIPNTKSVRKVLNEAGLPGAGKRLVPLMNNKIQYASTSEKTGMLVSDFGSSIRVFAETRHPVEDIEKAAKALRDKGYDVEVNGFTAYVNKTPPKETQKSSEDYIKEWKENEKKDVVDELEKYHQRVQEIKNLPIMERTAVERNIPSSYLNVVKHNFKDEDARKRSFDRYATQLVDSHFEALKDKVEKNIGPIVDIRRTGGPNDYVLTGESGKSVSIQVVKAGGYNKQRLHTRWVQNKLGPRDKTELKAEKEENTLSRIKKEARERSQEKFGDQKWIERTEDGEIIFKGVVKNVDTGEKKVMEFSGSSRKDAVDQLSKNGYSLASTRVLPRKLYDEVMNNTNGSKWDFEEASIAFEKELKAENSQKDSKDNFDSREKQIEANRRQAEISAHQNNTDEMNVPFDQWGREMDLELIHDPNDPSTIIGNIEDRTRFNYVPDIRPITKKKALDDIEGWKNDDGTYGTGDGDESIHVAYRDGRVIDLTDGDPHKKWSKQDIVGVHISTGDYEIAWGGEMNKRTGEIEPYETHEMDPNTLEDLPGHQNSYSGSKVSAEWKERVKTTSVKDENTGRYRQQREVIRKSTVKNRLENQIDKNFDQMQEQLQRSQQISDQMNGRTTNQSSGNDKISMYAAKLQQVSNKASYLSYLVRSGKITEQQREQLRATYKNKK